MSTQSAYDLIVVGTSFASSFFLARYLEHAAPSARVLVLERGERRTHKWLSQNTAETGRETRGAFINRTPDKPWIFNLTFGGSSNCWWACTPRMLPEDFELRTRYGRGADWPISYDDLEPYYCGAEEIMSISGPADSDDLLPRSRPFPQPPHLLTDPDRLLKRAFPDRVFVMPTARARHATSSRPGCCANGICSTCPVDAKFTILNGMGAVFADPRVEVRTGARVDAVETSNGIAGGVRYTREGRESVVRGEFIALGANALFNPFILMKSGLEHPELGRGLTEQVSVRVEVYLDGVDNFNGSTSLTAHGYMLYGGERRRDRAACLMETSNVPRLRAARGKWRQFLMLKFIFEDLRQDRNRVEVDPDDPVRPAVVFHGHSEYAMQGIEDLKIELPSILAALPVERHRFLWTPGSTEAHIMGTAVMGADAATSVVDRQLVHHRVRNLAVLGASAFPTAPPANPTLTLSALSLWSADRVFGPARG